MPALADFIAGIAGSLMAAVLFSVVIPPIRSFLLYRTHSYELSYLSDYSGCIWDIQWERDRLMIQIEDAHNDYLEDVKVVLNKKEPGLKLDSLSVGAKYVSDKGWPLQVKLDSITRVRPGEADRVYLIHLTVRRRRV